MSAFRINFAGLSNSFHHFSYEIGNDFFTQYGISLISEGSFQVEVDLNKHETFIEADIHIKGNAHLVCDRSLELFDYPIDTKNKIVFKFGPETMEITDEIVMISRETVSLELGQYIYELIGISIPMKKLHPKFKDDELESEEGGIIYSSGDIEKEEEIDPRWEQLKKLK